MKKMFGSTAIEVFQLAFISLLFVAGPLEVAVSWLLISILLHMCYFEQLMQCFKSEKIGENYEDTRKFAFSVVWDSFFRNLSLFFVSCSIAFFVAAYLGAQQWYVPALVHIVLSVVFAMYKVLKEYALYVKYNDQFSEISFNSFMKHRECLKYLLMYQKQTEQAHSYIYKNFTPQMFAQKMPDVIRLNWAS